MTLGPKDTWNALYAAMALLLGTFPSADGPFTASVSLIPSFLYNWLMNFTVNKANGGIRTANLWCWKLPLRFAYTTAQLGALCTINLSPKRTNFQAVFEITNYINFENRSAHQSRLQSLSIVSHRVKLK